MSEYRIPVGRYHFALVDEADFAWLSLRSWHMRGRYAARCVNHNKSIAMHREIMKPPEGLEVDHINLDPLDNRRANLRICTRQQNSCNLRKMRSPCSSPFKGVSRRRQGAPWGAFIKINGAKRSLGTFELEVDAARAYDIAAREHFGAFARPNFPDDGFPPPQRSKGRGWINCHHKKTACPKGHAYDKTDKHGYRQCRTCWRERWRALSAAREAIRRLATTATRETLARLAKERERTGETGEGKERT